MCSFIYFILVFILKFVMYRIRSIVLISIFIVVSVTTFGQKKLKLFLSPAAVLNPKLGLAIQPGVEYTFNPKMSLLGEFAIPILPNKPDSFYLHNKFSRTRLEFRYRFRKNAPFFLAFNLAYSPRSFDILKQGSYQDITQVGRKIYDFSAAHVKSNIFSSSLFCGFTNNFTKRFGAETFVGLGARWVNTKYSNQVGLVATTDTEFWGRTCSPITIDGDYTNNGKMNGVQLNLGVRLFYTLK